MNFLNNRIQFFDYGLIDKSSKPPLLRIDKGNNQLKMSASEMMIFTKYLGFLIADLIPEGDPVWELYIVLRKIVDIIVSPYVSHEHLNLLNSLIEEHRKLYLKWSDDQRLKNKHHRMVHYSWMLERFGPLIYLWSMRNEGKHRIGKSISTSISSRKDLTYSIATRMQLAFHSLLNSQKFLNEKAASDKPVLICFEDFNSLGFDLKSALPQGTLEIERVSWINYNGILYRENMVLVLGTKDFLPIFGLIKSIILYHTIIAFLCCPLETYYFDEHYYG